MTLPSPRLKLHGNQQEIGVSEGNEKGRESRFQALHVYRPYSYPDRSGSGSQTVIQIAVQKPLYKLIDTRRQVDTNKITLGPATAGYHENMHCLTPNVILVTRTPQSRALSDNFSVVANVKVYECKNLRLSVLHSINGQG